MSKNSSTLSMSPKVARILGFPMALNPFLADLKMNVNLSVFRRLGINGKTLHAMGIKELNLLYAILAQDMSVVTAESARRALRGKKTS